MKKNGFLTFIFACIPGAGQMYYGYMQRGLSLITMFIGCFIVGAIINPLAALAIIVWMYSFFDTYDLVRHLAAGDPKEDGLLLVGNFDDVKKLIPQHTKLVGWGLIGFGVWALYDLLIGNWEYRILTNVLGYGYAWDVINGIPNLVVGGLLVFAGFKLLNMHPAKKNSDDELPPYPHE
ncbi:hypothetical protein NE586_09700 [Gemmiger formicilis]|uniref:hypothetical protein n=1 Tax=Gemmiger formicilis TaxID=745368 RepID=UPI00210CC6CB|nr:hypothetical protein [Gemmiger formicilis]MCQ5080163.1 hypothetical protein [Gemmiger formicilis]MCQ5115732.1 hypothetical protein [Gemmiger formicilis]